MINKYYIQPDGGQALDIWVEFNMYVKSVTGLNVLPKVKDPYVKDWSDEQGDEVYMPNNMLYDSKVVNITFTIVVGSGGVDEVKSRIHSLLKLISDSKTFNYFDTYRKEGARLRYLEMGVISEKYRDNQSIMEFNIKLSAPNGICWGYDNSGYNGSLMFEVNSGTVDYYFSDGTVISDKSSSFVRSYGGEFIIVCPSIFGATDIYQRTEKVLGIGYSGNKTLGINTVSGDKVLGI